MAYLNKEDYERRQRNADLRMAENAKIETLSEEQHEAISSLATFRHDYHCNMNSIASHSPTTNEYTRKAVKVAEEIIQLGIISNTYIFLADDCEFIKKDIKITDYIANINEMIDTADAMVEDDEVAIYDYNYYKDTSHTIDDYEESRELRLEVYEFYHSRALKQADDLHKFLEKLLNIVDKQYGTNYAPTGALRLL